MTTKFCRFCGTQNNESAAFCIKCGERFTGQAAPSAPAPETQTPASPSGAAGVAGAVGAMGARLGNLANNGANMDENMAKAKTRMNSMLGQDYEEKLASRAPVDLNGISAGSRAEVEQAFAYFGLDITLPASDVTGNYDDEIVSMIRDIKVDDGDETVHVMESEGDDKRKKERVTVMDSSGEYARQFANTWAIEPSMISGEAEGKAARKEDLERMRHRVEMGEISSSEAAQKLDANKNASTR